MRAGFPGAAVGGVLALAFASLAFAQGGAAPGALGTMPLPGGVSAAQKILGDPTPPDRARFVLDAVKRFHHSPASANAAPDDPLPRLLAHLERAAAEGSAVAETVPLPLPAPLWVDRVFKGRARPGTLAADILRSREAALTYHGLLSMDDATRAWLATQPALVGEIAAQYAHVFVLAAPGLRMSPAGALLLPGGAAAMPAWEALTGVPASKPVEFVRHVLAANQGRLAYFVGTIASLSDPQLRALLRLDRAGAASVDAVARMAAVFTKVASDWRIDGRTFWRPALDPALLVVDLPADAEGGPRAYGSERFWTAAFDGDRPAPAGRARQDAPREPADLVWLCERVFADDAALRPQRYRQVLFAARLMTPQTPEDADAVAAVSGFARFPALVATLERAGIGEVPVYGRVARRAYALSSIADDERGIRSLAQFQGGVALVARAVARGSLSAADGGTLLAGLADIATNDRGDYEGRVAEWLVASVVHRPAAGGPAINDDHRSSGASAVDERLLALLAGPGDSARIIEWEGTTYAVDLAAAERGRLQRLLGDRPRPYLSAAGTLLSLASSLEQPGAAARKAGIDKDLDRLADDVGWSSGEGWPDERVLERYRAARAAAGQPARGASSANAAALAARLRALADDLVVRGLIVFAYATALGQPDRGWLTADEAAVTHDFGQRINGVRRRDAPWRLPVVGGDTRRDWHATGSILGLDLRLAELSLVRLSLKPPPRRPTLNEEQRRTFVETVALVQPALLRDDDRDGIAAALARGRERWHAAASSPAVLELADGLRLPPASRSLLAWRLAHDPATVAGDATRPQLLALGLGAGAAAPAAWGVAAEARSGCLCLQVTTAPADVFAGRWGTGIHATAFPDLTLRLGELLAEMKMPAALLGPVLTSAVLDFVNGAVVRYGDDRRGLEDFVAALTVPRLEQYLALLTTDGPLVPAPPAGGATLTKTGSPR